MLILQHRYNKNFLRLDSLGKMEGQERVREIERERGRETKREREKGVRTRWKGLKRYTL